ncbi:MAG: MarR family transcriptional regulator [Gemmatimonadetes bacterium]|nr:MarR family transcriptional regulator [Gemmatimonadota bacterium]
MAERFFRVAGRLHGALDAALGEVGLSVPTLLALKHLIEAEKALPLGQLAARTECGKSHMTQLVDRLETEGLVARIADPDDRRSVLAALTDEGRRRYVSGIQVVGRVEEEFFGRLGRRDRAGFHACLDRLLEG